MKKFLFIVFSLFAAALFAVWFISLFAPRRANIEYGLTFSSPYAASLGLDWRQAYTDILDGLKPRRVRLSAYWNQVEPSPDAFNFQDLDFQIYEAERRNVDIVLAVGRRLPRWPECHDPHWISGMSDTELRNSQLSYVETVVRRYQKNYAVKAWQVENEPFLSTFGICPPLDESLLDHEIDLVKKLDLSRPVIVTDSGELSLWLKAGSKGDIFGTTFYRFVFSDVLKRYWTNRFPALMYRFKAGLVSLFNPGKPIAIMELQAEPWTTKGITQTPLEEQYLTMSPEKFDEIVAVAATTGFSPQYLWGAEWWYWAKLQGRPEFWERAARLLKN